MKKNFIIIMLVSLSILLVIAFFMDLFPPAGASEEYIYTVKQIYRVLLFLTLFVTLPTLVGICKGRLIIWILACGLCCCLVPIFGPPFIEIHWTIGIIYSLCWFISLFCASALCFIYTRRHANFLSWITPILGTLFFLCALLEGYSLQSSQSYQFGYWDDTQHSNFAQTATFLKPQQKHLKTGDFIGNSLNQNYTYPQKSMRFNRTLFDVEYTIDKYGHRILPERDNPKADLLLFGCSFTFGYGLMDEETWAYKLSRDLGPDWQVVNYGQPSFGAQQMYGLIINNELEPLPATPVRQALFFGINHHLQRFTGLWDLKSEWYELEDGNLIRKGYTTESPLHIITAMRGIFNGSNAAGYVYNFLVGAFRKMNDEEYAKIYVKLICESAKILKEKYNTTLTVLLWPDVEEVAEPLRQNGLNVLLAKTALKDWDKDSDQYYIVPRLEYHPNDKASTLLANYLADYYREILAR